MASAIGAAVLALELARAGGTVARRRPMSVAECVVPAC